MYQRRPSSIVFKKAGISNSSKLSVTDTDDPFKALTEDLSHLREIDQNAVQEKLPAKSFIGLDNNIVTTVPISSDEDFVADILNPVEDNKINEDINNVDVDVEGLNRPSNIALEEALDKLYNLSLFTSTYGSEI